MAFPLDPSLWNAQAGPSRVSLTPETGSDGSEVEPEMEQSSEEEGSVYRASEDSDEGDTLLPHTRSQVEDVTNAGLDKLLQSVFHGEARDQLLNPSAPAGALGQQWDRSIRDVLEDLENDPATRSGKRRRSRKSATIALSPQVKSLLAQANAHFVQQDYSAAIAVLQEIIRIEPNTKSAYHTLSAIHTELGSHEKALQLDIVAAHIVPREGGVWRDLGARSRQAGLLQQAIYCFTSALGVNRNDVDALWDRAVLYGETGQIMKATSAFNTLLRLNPHDPTILRELVPILVKSEQVPDATRKLKDAFDFHVPNSPTGPNEYTLNLEDLIDLANLLNSQRRFKDVIPTVKFGQRWVQGRYETGAVWDLFQDDREYDAERKTRPDWEKNEQLRWLEDMPTYELNLQLRAALGIARLMLNNVEEADIHLARFRELDVLEHFQLIGEVADAYLEKKEYQTALDLYQDISECEAADLLLIWARIAECNRALGNFQVAVEYYEAVLNNKPDDHDVRLQLAEVYEDLGNRTKALALVNEVIEARRAALAKAPAHTAATEELEDNVIDMEASFFAERVTVQPLTKSKRKEIKREQRHIAETQRQADFEAAYTKLGYLDDGMQNGDAEAVREWLEVASYLIDGFRETPELFPRDGKTKYHGIVSRKVKKRKADGAKDTIEDANELADRLERQISEDTDEPDVRVKRKNVVSHTFCNISFDDWLVLALRYAFMLTKTGEHEEADAVLRHLCLAANFRQVPERMQALMFAIVACHMHVGDLDAACSEVRRIILRFNHLQTQSTRILSAMFAVGQPASLAYSAAKLQKFNLRSLKAIDTNVLQGKETPGMRHRRKSKPAEEDVGSDEEEVERGAEELFKPTIINPHLLMFYANSLHMSRSHQSALFYYLRAYEACPTDPGVCLATGIAYLARALQRQTDNRHHQIAQAFTLLSKYRKLRGPCQEVEYNFGRAFHMLGIYGLAYKHYQRVLQMEADLQNEEDMSGSRDRSLTLYAAFNLQQLHLQDGSPLAAKAVGERWLTL